MYGVIGGIFAEQLGSAVVQNGGQYSGEVDKGYIVEIDSVAGGKEVGQATFKWSDTEGVTWNETGVLTQTDPYLMSNGVTVKFTAGTGDDFELGDKWSWLCKNNYGKQKLIDLDRDFWYQSRSLDNPNTIVLDFGSAKNILACKILDHNLSTSAVIKLMGNDADSWVSPAYSNTLTWNSEKIGVYLDQTYRYWNLQMSDQSNLNGYLKIGELYLGGYLELSRNFSYGWSQIFNAFETALKSRKGTEKKSLDYLQDEIEISFRNLPETDIDSLLAMLLVIKNKTDGTISPVFFDLDSDSPNDYYLVHLPPQFARVNKYLDIYDVSLKLSEVVKTNV
jgi:hypothetical protein